MAGLSSSIPIPSNVLTVWSSTLLILTGEM
jgi:hypothetical protein